MSLRGEFSYTWENLFWTLPAEMVQVSEDINRKHYTSSPADIFTTVKPSSVVALFLHDK